MLIVAMTMAMSVTVTMMVPAQQPDTRNVDQQPNRRDWNCFAELNAHRRAEPRESFVANQRRNHRQHDGAGEPGRVTELAGTETNRESVAYLRA
jgi:hypothetical protein